VAEQRTYEVRFTTVLEAIVTVQAEDEEEAVYAAGDLAEEYANSLPANDRVRSYATFDGKGADSVEVLP
jgi:hypothetical protein